MAHDGVRAAGSTLRRIGVLMNLAADDPVSTARAKALDQGLQALGWIDGQKVHVDYRWAAGKADLFPRYTAELVALAADVILTSGIVGVPPVVQATRTIPVVFRVAPGPVGNGYVAFLWQPGGKSWSSRRHHRQSARVAALKAQERALAAGDCGEGGEN